MNKLLEINGISKSFPGVQALKDVSITIQSGEVHALVGENGAGKSTLIKIISGAYSADCGTVLFEGNEIVNSTPTRTIEMGISTVHQELKLVESLTIMENIFLGTPIVKRSLLGKKVDWAQMYKQAQHMIDDMGINLDAKTVVEELSVAKKQIVEICKALSRNAKLIIMDEPSATLTDKEMDILFDIINKLKQNNIAVIYISHRLEEIFKIADTYTVLRDGQLVESGRVSNIDKSKLIKLMVGREIQDIYPEKKSREGNVLLEVKGITRKGVLNSVSFSLRKGEILGIAGLVGAGRTELARAIFGADNIDSGEVLLNGKSTKIRTVADAIRANFALVPEERKKEGIILEMSVAQNVTLVGLNKTLKNGAISAKKEHELANKFISMLRIATPSDKFLIKNLSGGNQQKCVLAKWLLNDAEVFIFDEPTRGIDVGAKQEIYKLLNEIVDMGKGIIMISSELPEVMGISNRVLVMHEGMITGEVIPDQSSQEEIMHYATI